ncbi:MAG: hypothetical protein QM760_15475 [Nibricoccus sp.]
MIAHAAELKPDRFREIVPASADRLRINLRLTTLNLALPTVAAERTPAQPKELLGTLESMEMKSTLAEAQKRYAVVQGELF